MTVYVFTGPTLSPEEARAELDAIYLPPVAQGDVYRVTLRQPLAIGIIDGYFERVPAVWHKEILWAMTQGIHVYGSASMGALRAAELAPFGMEGVGAIFEAYRDGALEDDDEVAVAHGSAESGYRPGSVAMVNIRRTLTAAEASRVIRRSTRVALERITKRLFYPGRAYPTILREAAAQGLPAKELDRLREWLPLGAVDQKRDDARAMLRVMREQLAAHPGPKRVRYPFQYTELWDHVRWSAGELQVAASGSADTLLQDALIDELRLEPDDYARARRGALLRFLALEEAWRQGLTVTPPMVEAATQAFRSEHGLQGDGDVDRWIEATHLSHEQFMRLMQDEARMRWVDARADREVEAHLPDYLRVMGEYVGRWARAQDKQRVLEARGLTNPTLSDCGMRDEQLLRWYFKTWLHRQMAPDVARSAGVAGHEEEEAFRRALLREFYYTNREG